MIGQPINKKTLVVKLVMYTYFLNRCILVKYFAFMLSSIAAFASVHSVLRSKILSLRKLTAAGRKVLSTYKFSRKSLAPSVVQRYASRNPPFAMSVPLLIRMGLQLDQANPAVAGSNTSERILAGAPNLKIEVCTSCSCCLIKLSCLQFTSGTFLPRVMRSSIVTKQMITKLV